MVTKLPAKRAESVFADFKPAYNRAQALVEANRCLYCQDAPCIAACPTSINIPEFIRRIATANVEGAARVIFDSNILGMSCARVCPVEVLCVGDCVYNRLGVAPIQIGKLQRYATDAAFDADWVFHEAGSDSGKRVALIGAGPASLACAHRLRRFGHAVTIYEKRTVVGGLNVYGVAPYKLKADRALEEVAWVLGIGGIDIKTGVEVGVDVSFERLEAEYDAVFVGVGLGADKHLGVRGEELENVYGAVDFIEAMKLEPVELARVERAVVVGGGNTAVDCVREALGLGVEAVTMVYRGTEAGMSGYAHEWKVAKLGGAQALWQHLPVAYEGEGGRVTGVRVVAMDADKRPVPGTEQLLPADLVLVAVGQSRLLDLLGELPGVRTDGRRVLVDADGFTGRAGVYAGGDLVNGAKEVVNAVAEGRDAALGIHAYLTAASEG